jgi:hypothetical protein
MTTTDPNLLAIQAAEDARRRAYFNTSFASNMVEKYQCLLEKSAGLKSVSVEGEMMSLADLEVKWQFWKNELAKAEGYKPRISAIQIGGV